MKTIKLLLLTLFIVAASQLIVDVEAGNIPEGSETGYCWHSADGGPLELYAAVGSSQSCPEYTPNHSDKISPGGSNCPVCHDCTIVRSDIPFSP